MFRRNFIPTTTKGFNESYLLVILQEVYCLSRIKIFNRIKGDQKIKK